MYFFYDMAMKLYRRIYKPSTTPAHRNHFWAHAPHLKPNKAWQRAAYEMTVFSWSAAHHTGICYAIALMATCYARDVLGKKAQVVALFEDVDFGKPVFWHAVMLMDGKYYDIFHPRGTSNIDLVYYGGNTPKRLVHDYHNPNAPLWGEKDGLVDVYFKPLQAVTYLGGSKSPEFNKHFLRKKPLETPTHGL